MHHKCLFKITKITVEIFQSGTQWTGQQTDRLNTAIPRAMMLTQLKIKLDAASQTVGKVV